MLIIVNLDRFVKEKNVRHRITEKDGISMADIYVIKNGKAKGIGFTTVETIYKELEFQPGAILEYGD